MYFAQFLRRKYAYTVLLKRSVLDIRELENEFRYFKIELVDILFIDLVRIVCSFFSIKIIFVNNKNGMVSLICQKHYKTVSGLDFFPLDK